MRLTVLGATGGTGTQLARQALAAGHDVVAVVRDPGRLAVPEHERRHVVRAAATDPDAILPAVKGADAVVSALGTRRRGPTSICADGVDSALTAMRAAGVRRLVVVSANGAYHDRGDGLVTRRIVKPILQRLLREGFADTRRMEELVRASDTDWTIMRPPRLTDGRHRGTYRTAVDAHVGTGISRADLADAILAALADPATVGHHIGVGY